MDHVLLVVMSCLRRMGTMLADPPPFRDEPGRPLGSLLRRAQGMRLIAATAATK